jgi:hypothetical protein
MPIACKRVLAADLAVAGLPLAPLPARAEITVGFINSLTGAASSLDGRARVLVHLAKNGWALLEQ